MCVEKTRNFLIYIGDIMALVNIWITNECNLECKYCYEGKKSNTFLKEEYVTLIVDFITRNSLEDGLIVNFHGGEPLLNFGRMKEIVCSISDKFPDTVFSLTTNMLLMTEEIATFIKERRVYVSVSLDGGETVNDKNRVDKNGEGTYKKVLNKIQILKRNNIPFRTRMTVTPGLVDKLYKSVLFLEEQQCLELVAVPDLFDEKWNDKNIRVLEKQLDEIYNYTKGKPELSFSFYTDKIRKIGKCYGGVYEFNIGCTGDIFPCTYVVGKHEFKIGNLNDGLDLEKINYFQKNFQMDNKDCTGCNYMDYCMTSRCKVLNKVIAGDFLKSPQIICEIENIMKRINMRMKLYSD